MDNTLYSFDIFDTLLIRRVASSQGIWAIIQEKLVQGAYCNEFLRKNFYRIRKGAEEFARYSYSKIKNKKEITFDDIYDVIKNNYNLSNKEIAFLKQMEISVEINNLLPLNKNLTLLKDLISQNKRVVLISDMYYGENYLREILTHVDSVFKYIKIYSSADYNVSKANKGLYNVVRVAEKTEFSDWIHYGDNYNSDIKSAQELGIKAIYLPQKPLLPYEEWLLKKNSDTGIYQIIVGNARISRISNNISEKIDKYDFGASFAGAILYNYVDWVLSQALEKNFKTLYFVARDGYILKIIADIIINKKNLSINTKYIYGSRAAWREPVDENYEIFVTGMFNEYRERLTPEFLAYRFDVDIKTMLGLLGLHSSKAKINPEKINDYIELFKQNVKIKQTFLNLRKERVMLLKKYLTQEIDFSEENIALVDMQGSGRTQDCISVILNQIKPCKLYSFYFINTLSEQKDNSIKLSYFSTIKYKSHWIELLCRNTDGQTVGYKEENSKIIPCFEKNNSFVMQEWGFQEYLNGIIAYTNNILEAEELNGIKTNKIDLYCNYFEYLTQNIDKKTASILGKIPFLSIGNESENIFEAAPPIRVTEVLINWIFGKKLNCKYVFQYISFARSSKLSRILQKLTQKYPSLQKFLFDFYVHKKRKKAYIRILGIKFSFGGMIWSQ